MFGCFGDFALSAKKCRKCALKEIELASIDERAQEYASLLPPQIKADGDEYRRRLAVCESCDMLIDGMCGECGCFVKLRAAKRPLSCPVNKW
jgi:hypothetical protein